MVYVGSGLLFRSLLEFEFLKGIHEGPIRRTFLDARGYGFQYRFDFHFEVSVRSSLLLRRIILDLLLQGPKAAIETTRKLIQFSSQRVTP